MAASTLEPDPRRFYVYVIFRPNGIPCYVGKGQGGRWSAHIRRSHNPHLAAIYAKAGGDLPIIKARDSLTESEAFETEIALIAALGREACGGPLVNLTDGGEGTSGAVHGPDVRAHMSAARSKSQTGAKRGPYSEAHREAIRQSLLGRTKGVPKSAAHRAAMRKPKSAEFRASVSEMMKRRHAHNKAHGISLSSAARENLSKAISALRWWCSVDGQTYRAIEPRHPLDVAGRKRKASPNEIGDGGH